MAASGKCHSKIMNPIEWLEQNVNGFASLPQADREAIFHFLLLWSLFEARALQTSASASRITDTVHKWAAQDKLRMEPFQKTLNYYRQRYCIAGQETGRYKQLRLRENDNSALVWSVLQGADDSPEDCVAAILIIVYRLRNNLFHGVKWEYGLSGQIDNLVHANAVLINALSLLERV